MSEIDRLWTQVASLADFQDREKIYRNVGRLCGGNFAEHDMEPNYGKRYLIHARAAEAKRRVDDTIAALEKAVDEWRQACIECERIDGEQKEEKSR